MMRAAFSSSGAPGSSRFTRRAFMPPVSAALAAATRPRAAPGSPRRPSARRLRARDELGELVAQRGELVLADEARERLVRLRLLGAQARDQRLDPGRSGAAIDFAISSSAAIETSRSRRSPSASASAFTSRSAGLQLAARKAGPEDLERRPQPPRRHAHVVDALDVVDVEHALRVVDQLADADLDDLRRRDAVGLVGAPARESGGPWPSALTRSAEQRPLARVRRSAGPGSRRRAARPCRSAAGSRAARRSSPARSRPRAAAARAAGRARSASRPCRSGRRSGP